MGVVTKSKPLIIPDDQVLISITSDVVEGIEKNYPAVAFKGELIPKETITSRVKELAQDIKRDFSPKDSYILWVKKGAKPFFEELYPLLSPNGEFPYDGIEVTSYKGTKPGELTIKDFDYSKIIGKNVLLVEDVDDTGKTATSLEEKVMSEGAASVTMAALVFKDSPKSNGHVPGYIGIEIGDNFIVGYGLDIDQECRDLKSIYVLSDIGKKMYEKPLQEELS